MTALYATDDVGNVIRRIDPFTGQAGDTIPVADPYNMYFTPDGKYAISVAEDLRSLIWYDPVTWQEVDRVQYPRLPRASTTAISPRTARSRCSAASSPVGSPSSTCKPTS